MLGLVIGAVNANFFHEELRPLILRTLQKPKAKYVWISLGLFAVMFIQVLAAYLYVDNFYEIPETWKTTIFSLCKNPRKTQLFHHNNMVCAGYQFFIPVIYFWRARAEKSDKGFNGNNNQFIFSKRTAAMGILIGLARAAVQYVGEMISTDILPRLIYGTKDLDVMPDLVLKRLLLSFFLATFPVVRLEQMIR